MKKQREFRIVVHPPEDMPVLLARVGECHADIIERRLEQSGLTAVEKIRVIEGIMERKKRQRPGETA